MNNKIKYHILLLAFCCSLLSCSGNNSDHNQTDLPTLIPYRSGKLWGYCDKDKKIKIKPEYAGVTFFNEMGLAQVYKPNIITGNENNDMSKYLTGVIDSLGNEIIPIKYPNYHHSFLLVHYDGKSKDKFGPFEAVMYGDFQIVIINQKLENLRANLNVVFPEMPNMQIVSIKNEYKDDIVYNRNGNSILPDSFKIPYRILNPWKIDFSGNIFFAEHKTKNYIQVFDTMGNLLNDKKFKEVKRLNDTLYSGVDLFSGLHGLYHISGKVIFDNVFNIKTILEKQNPEMGLIALVSKTDEALYSLKLKKYIVHSTSYGKISHDAGQARYKNIFFHNNMLLINYGKDKSEIGLFSNETGEMIVKGYPQMHVDFSFQHIFGKNNKTVHLYDFNANLLNEFQDVDTVIPISHKHYLVSRNSKVGIWSQQTKTYIVDIAFENIDFSLPDVFLAQNTDKKITVYDSVGKKIFPQQFEKHKVIYENMNKVGGSYLNIGNKEGFNIKPSLVYSGSSKSFHFQFTQEQYYMPDNIVNFHNKDYDRILKELKKEIITVILEDSLGNRFRLMPDYSLKPLSKETDLVYRVQSLYFYGKNLSSLKFYINQSGEKREINSMEVEYFNGLPYIIVGISKTHIFDLNYYPFDPISLIQSATAFNSIRTYYDKIHVEENDKLCFYGESGNNNLLLSSELNVLLKLPKKHELGYQHSNYYVIGNKKNKQYLLTIQGKALFKHYCDINPTNYDNLIGLSNCTYYEDIFVGYANINGTKYFD